MSKDKKKKPGTQTGTALVRASQRRALEKTEFGAADSAKVALIRKDFDSARRNRFLSVIKNTQWALGAMHVFTFLSTGFPVFNAAIAVGWFFIASQDDRRQRQRTQKAFDNAHERLQDQFIAAQKTAYQDSQEYLMKLADRQLADNFLLDEQTLSYLVLTPPEILEDASDRLAITVMQARQMVAFVRTHYDKDDGVDLDNVYDARKRRYSFVGLEHPPLTYKNLELQKHNDDDRQMLRSALAEQDGLLLCDQGSEAPKYKKADLPAPKLYEENGWRTSVKRTLILPVVSLKEAWKQRSHKLPELPEPVAPSLLCVKGFAEMLADYEQHHERLDLPAMREKRAGLPGVASDKSSRNLPRL